MVPGETKMSALFSKPKAPPPPKPAEIKIQPPAAPPPVAATPAQTNAPQQAFLRSRRRKGSGLSGLILTPLGAGTQGGKSTLGV
jgi:hypothetical protein